MLYGFTCDIFYFYLICFLFHFYCIIKVRHVLRCRLHESGLLPLCRMVEASVGQGPDGGSKKRMSLDQGLLAALVDRGCLETHTFHLLCREMASTLHDISYLLGLPIVEEAVGGSYRPRDVEGRCSTILWWCHGTSKSWSALRCTSLDRASDELGSTVQCSYTRTLS
jgi:hypothetical protein